MTTAADALEAIRRLKAVPTAMGGLENVGDEHD